MTHRQAAEYTDYAAKYGLRAIIAIQFAIHTGNEAEATAMLCCAALGLPGLEDSRGYVQHWYGAGHPIPDTSVRKIFKTADAILRAGRPDTPKQE